MKWVGYWRRNPQIFVKDYLGVNLKPYQKLLFYMMNKSSYFEKRERNLMKWVGYWRRNPQIFVKDYLGVNLKPYQKLLFYMMNKVDFFMYIAARGAT